MPATLARSVPAIVLLNVGLWTLLCAVGALSSYGDHLRRGVDADFVEILGRWWLSSLLLQGLSSVLSLYYARRPASATRAGAIALGYVLLLLLFMPLEVSYQSARYIWQTQSVFAWSLVLADLRSSSIYQWFVCFLLMTMTYVTILAVSVGHQTKARDRAWQQAQTDNWRLRVELEQQRLVSLRGQLEPHFMFNALNAISALVRSDDKKVALGGINRLSDLLRYALTACERDAVPLADELAFIDNYLALQRLRYGARLRVRVERPDAKLLATPCPPLLLQPLIENALRHDFDRHDQESDIAVVLRPDGRWLEVCISNPMRGEMAPNPGLGLGLRQTRARLRHAFGQASALDAGAADGRYTVRFKLPLAA